MIGTVFFNWYGVRTRNGVLEPSGAQWTSAWQPLDGRLSWNASPEYYERHLSWVHEAGFDYVLVQAPRGHMGSVRTLLKSLEKLNRNWRRKLYYAPYFAYETFETSQDRKYDFRKQPDRAAFNTTLGSWLDIFAKAPTELWARDPWNGRPMMGMWWVKGARTAPLNLADEWRGEVQRRIGESPFIHGHDGWPEDCGIEMFSFLFNGMHSKQVWKRPDGSDAPAVDLLPGFMNVVADEAQRYFAPRAAGRTYREGWRWVLANSERIDLVVVESWNEEHESSGVRPAKPGQRQHPGIPSSRDLSRREAAMRQTRHTVREDEWGNPRRYMRITQTWASKLRQAWAARDP